MLLSASAQTLRRCHVERSETSLIYFRLRIARRTRSEILRFAQNDRLTLIDRHVLVVLLQRLSVLGDLNGFRIEDPNRHVLTAKFNRAISRRDPSFERCFCLVAERHSHVSSFDRLDGDSVLLRRIPVEANWLPRPFETVLL